MPLSEMAAAVFMIGLYFSLFSEIYKNHSVRFLIFIHWNVKTKNFTSKSPLTNSIFYNFAV